MGLSESEQGQFGNGARCVTVYMTCIFAQKDHTFPVLKAVGNSPISYNGGCDKCPLHCYAMSCSIGPKGSALRSSRHEH